MHVFTRAVPSQFSSTSTQMSSTKYGLHNIGPTFTPNQREAQCPSVHPPTTHPDILPSQWHYSWEQTPTTHNCRLLYLVFGYWLFILIFGYLWMSTPWKNVKRFYIQSHCPLGHDEGCYTNIHSIYVGPLVEIKVLLLLLLPLHLLLSQHNPCDHQRLSFMDM